MKKFDEFNVEIPELPKAELEQKERKWFFDSSRDYKCPKCGELLTYGPPQREWKGFASKPKRGGEKR